VAKLNQSDETAAQAKAREANEENETTPDGPAMEPKNT